MEENIIKHISVKLIEIDWKGPLSLNELNSLSNSEIDYGLYQVYGRHPLYGGSVLLYIGKAAQQTIGMRVLQEGWDDTNDSSSIRIYYGRLIGKETPEESIWSNDIDLAERLLIHVHKPAYNSKGLYKIPDENLKHLHLLNWGDHCDLYPEVSGYRWTTLLDNEMFDYYRYK